jgi:YtcA family
MRHGRRPTAVVPILTGVLAISGCVSRGAPSFILFGAFFPAWMLVAGIGIVLAIVTRGVLLATGLAQIVPLQLLVCVSVGLAVAILIWALWFGT